MKIANNSGYLEIDLSKECNPNACQQQLDQYLQQHDILKQEKIKVNFNIRRHVPNNAFCIIEHFLETIPDQMQIKLNNINLFDNNPEQLKNIIAICNKATNLYGMGHIIIYANKFKFPYLETIEHRTKFRIFKPHQNVFANANKQLFLNPKASFTLDHLPQELPIHIVAALKEDRFNVINVLNYHNTVQTPYSEAAYHTIEEYYGQEEATRLLFEATKIIQGNKTMLKQAFLKYDPELINKEEFKAHFNGSNDLFTITNQMLLLTQ